MRVLRIFFVAAQAWSQFPVDILLPPREHELQSPPRALRKRMTPHRDALYHAYACKPFTMRSYEKCVRKSFTMRSCKIIGLKVPWNEHL